LHPRCYLGSGAAAPHCEMPLHQEKGERLAVWQLISLRECFYQHRHFQEVSFSPRCSFLGITPTFAAGLERSGKPVRQHVLVRQFHSLHLALMCLPVPFPKLFLSSIFALNSKSLLIFTIRSLLKL